MPFFHFKQNNSGGSFDFEFDRGITHHVLIEAPDAEAACIEAIMHGIYFDGIEQGMDCACCGDRWHKPYDEGTAEPMLYGDPLGVQTAVKSFKPRGWMHPNPETVVHFANGTRKWFWADNTQAEEADSLQITFNPVS